MLMAVALHGPLLEAVKVRLPRPILLYSWQHGERERSESILTRVRVSLPLRMLDFSNPVMAYMIIAQSNVKYCCACPIV